MVRYRPAPTKQYPLQQAEVFPEQCPNGCRAWQRPSWHGCMAGGHRTYNCDSCRVHHEDMSCPCFRTR